MNMNADTLNSEELKRNIFGEMLNTASSLIIFVPITILALILLYFITKKHIKWYNSYKAGSKHWYDIPLLLPLKLIFYVLRFLGLKIKELGEKIWPFIKKYKFQFFIGILTIVIFAGSLFVMHNIPSALSGWSTVVSWTALILMVFAAIASFVSVVKKPYEEPDFYVPKTYRLAKESGRYLFYVICLSIFLAILGFVGYLLTQSEVFTVSSTLFLMLVSGFVLSVVLYQMGKKYLKSKLKNNTLFNILYHAVFIIPCIFIETAEYLYREFKTTPRFIYGILGAEMVVISLWFILPMISKFLYTWMPGSNNKSQIVKDKLLAARQMLSKVEDRQTYIRNIDSNIPASLWNKIVRESLFQPDKKQSLVDNLHDLGFESDEIINNLTKLVQKYGFEYQRLEIKKKEFMDNIRLLSEQQDNLKTIQKGTVLLSKAKYLNHKNVLSFDRTEHFNETNYDYSISFWFFLHSNNKEYKSSSVKKNILNFDKRPQVLYNIQNNTLEVQMNNGVATETIYTKKEFPLQRWHNIVVNYTGGVVDIFMNSELIATRSQILPKMNLSDVILGENGGVSGGVTNVVYFPSHMSQERIQTNYNLLKNNPQRNPSI